MIRGSVAQQVCRVYYDSQTGLYKMGARYYDPTIGRFTHVDPIALPNIMKNGGWPWFIQLYRSGQDGIGALSNAAFCQGECNFFIYSGNNPVNMGDPTGYFKLGKFFFRLFEKRRESNIYKYISLLSYNNL